MDYIDNYNPEEEDIFGSNVKIRPKRVEPSEAQKKDPLRKWKVRINAFLSAEKTPITSAHLAKRMWDEQSLRFECGTDGFNSLDELLHALVEEVVKERLRDGTYVYSAKTNEANSAIREMVAKQNDPGDIGSRNKSFLRTNKNSNHSHGSAFRTYKGPSAVVKDLVLSTSSKISPPRSKYPKTLAKTEERAKVAAQYLLDEWDSMCQPHPMDPRDSQKSVVTLAKLQDSFSEAFRLPMWGKLMSENELYRALDQPPFNNHLKMWKMPGKPVVYVEPIINSRDENSNVLEEEVAGSNENEAEITPTRRETHIEHLMSESRLLENWEDTEGQFARGPGFSEAPIGLKPTANSTSSNRANPSEKNREKEERQVNMRSGNDQRKQETFYFGEGPKFQSSRAPSVAASTASGANNVWREMDRAQSRSRSRARNAPSCPMDEQMKQLAHYCAHRGCLNYEHLNENEKRIVTHSVNFFRTYSISLGETLVQFNEDAERDIDFATFEYGNLRSVVESDVRWMSESSSPIKTNGPFLGRVIQFVPPRGFLLIDLKTDSQGLVDLDKMNEMLSASMEINRRPLEMKNVHPGLACIYHYSVKDTSQWFRVLILKKSLKKSAGCVGAILVDVNDRYLVDIELSELYELPESCSFQTYRPNVLFAVLSGIDSINENTQKHMLDVLESEVTTSVEDRPAIPAYFYPNNGTEIPAFDMVWLDDSQNLQWFSLILKEQKGAVMRETTKFPHYSVPIEDIYNKCDKPELYQYRGPASVVYPDSEEEDIRRRELTREEVAAIRAVSLTHLNESRSIPEGKSPRSDDMLVEAEVISPSVMTATFEMFMLTKSLQPISAVAVLVDAMAKRTGDAVWADLRKKMTDDVFSQFGIHLE